MPFTFSWRWRMRSSPEDLWPFVSDTDRFNALVGLPAVEMAADEHTPWPLLRQHLWGQTLEWEEPPFEWVAPRWFRVERRYRRGPIASMRLTLHLAPDGRGGSLLTYTVEAQPAGLLGFLFIPLHLGLIHRRQAERVFRQFDSLAAEARANASAPERALLPQRPRLHNAGLVEEYAHLLVEQGFDKDLVTKLAELVRTAPDDRVARMHPRLLARHWGADEQETVRLFFHASRLGLLELRWDVVCPSCYGVPLAVGHLRALPEKGHCPLCHIAYEADFEHIVHVTFRPHPAVRDVVVPTYCVGGPRNTPHLLAQQRLAPGEARTLELDLEEGEYRLRWPTHPQWQETLHAFDEWAEPHPWQARLVVEAADAGAEAHFTLKGALTPATVRLRPGRVALTIANAEGQPHLVGVERLAWAEYVLTAARVLTIQAFRDLFPFESLRKGMQIHVSSVTILFTDLRGSTAFYRQVGDGPAFDRVSAHFDILRRNVEAHGGAIVKTIGDAIMGAFPTLEAGLRAAVGILRDIAAYNARHPDWPLRLRLGLNAGPALVVTLNEQLDYFGSTVNMAAKLERQSRGNEIVMPRALADRLATLLEGLAVEDDQAAIPGEAEPIPVVRMRLAGEEIRPAAG